MKTDKQAVAVQDVVTPVIDNGETVSQAEIDRLKAEAAADLANPTPETVKREDRPSPTPREVARAGAPVNPNSIRQTVITMLLAGKATADIAAVLRDKFPTSAAAAKSVKHIAFYRAVLRREGKLAKVAR